MQYCEYCGAPNADTAGACSECGRRLWGSDNVTSSSTGSTYRNASGVNYGVASSGWWWIGFINFIAGFILGGVLQPKMPDAASKAKNGAIVGLIVSIIAVVFEACSTAMMS